MENQTGVVYLTSEAAESLQTFLSTELNYTLTPVDGLPVSYIGQGNDGRIRVGLLPKEGTEGEPVDFEFVPTAVVGFRHTSD